MQDKASALKSVTKPNVQQGGGKKVSVDVPAIKQTRVITEITLKDGKKMQV